MRSSSSPSDTERRPAFFVTVHDPSVVKRISFPDPDASRTTSNKYRRSGSRVLNFLERELFWEKNRQDHPNGITALDSRRLVEL